MKAVSMKQEIQIIEKILNQVNKEKDFLEVKKALTESEKNILRETKSYLEDLHDS